MASKLITAVQEKIVARSAVPVQGSSIRVLHVIPQADGHNSEFIFAKRQVSSLQEAGVVNRVFYLFPTEHLLPQWRKLSHEIRLFRPHLLHAHYGTMTAFLAAIGMGVPLVVTFRGSDLNPDSSVGRLRFVASRLLSQFAAARARQIVCVTAELRLRLWWGRAKATVSSGGIDLQRYPPMPRDDARRRLGWPTSTKVVLFNAGRNPRLKRIDLANKAVEVGRTIVPELRMSVLRGDVDPDTVPLMLNAADCLLVTSDSEGSPYIVKEALACNLPIVSVAVGDVPERLANVTTSRIVARNAAEIGRAIAEIVLSGQRSNGRETIADISDEAEIQRLYEVYQRALE